MKLTPFYLAAIAPLAVVSCTGGAFLGQVMVLVLTLGIFIGTLSLGRRSAVAASVPEQTTSDKA